VPSPAGWFGVRAGPVGKIDQQDEIGDVPDFSELLERNRAWAVAKREEDPQFFKKLATGQSPPFLFFGCSDSRKVLGDMTGTGPGELFVHRNIGNQVPLEDGNVQSVLEYAILSLQVRHVVVGGHTGCGGVGAALAGLDEGAVGAWLRDLRALAVQHKDELDPLPSLLDRANRLAEINVLAQVKNVILSPPYRKAVEEGVAPSVHGWMIDLNSGLIRELELPEAEWREAGLLP
jgi:carbonic anhydrase